MWDDLSESDFLILGFKPQPLKMVGATRPQLLPEMLFYTFKELPHSTRLQESIPFSLRETIVP